MENNEAVSNETNPVQQAASSLADLRKRIADGIKAKDSEGVLETAITEAKRKAILEAREALKQKPEYRKLQFGDDGLYVCVAELVYGKYASLTKTDETGIFLDLLCLPFGNAGFAEESRKRITALANKLSIDLGPALSPSRFVAIKRVITLLYDGATDFANLVPNPQMMSEIVREINRKTSTLRGALKNSWSLACYSFLQDVLHDVLSDRSEPELHSAVDDFARGFTSFLTKLQLAVSSIDQPDVSQADFSYDTVAIFKAVSVMKTTPVKEVPAENSGKMTLDEMQEKHRELLRALFSVQGGWLDLPFLTRSEAANYRHNVVRAMSEVQADLHQRCVTQGTEEELNKRTVYLKRIADLHDRVSVLTARYGGVFEVYKATATEREHYVKIAIRALSKARTYSLNGKPTKDNEKEVGAILHDLRAELASIVDHILDANIEPANIRDLRMSAVVAIMSYYTDMHRSIMAFLDGEAVPAINAKTNNALGYVSWLKGIADNKPGPSLFKELPSDEDEAWPEDDDPEDLAEMEEEDEDDIMLADKEMSGDAEYLCKTIEGFEAFYCDWSGVFKDEGELIDFWDSNVEIQEDYRTEKAKSQAAIASVLDSAKKKEEPDPDDEPPTESSLVADAQAVLDAYKGSHEVLMAHHKNAPLYYATNWGTYWDDYEKNLKKNYPKKKAKNIRRQEEDVVGILMYMEKNAKRLPYSMFFRSYVKKTRYTYTPPAPPAPPKPEDYKHYYFAYGSNLDDAQVEKRTTYAKFVGRAVLKNHKLTFITYNSSWQGGVANVEPSEGDVVYGILWAFTDEMRTKMDRYEGHPTKYLRHEVDVHQIVEGDIEGLPAIIKADVYEIKNEKDLHDFQPASEKYYNQIKAGYEKHKFPVVLLDEAQKFSTDNKVPLPPATTYTYPNYGGYNDYDDEYGYLGRRWGRGYYRGTQRSHSTTTPATTTPAATNRDSIFHPDKWNLDMTKEWWKATDI